MRKSGDKWPKFKEIGTQKIKLVKLVANEKNHSANPVQVAFVTKYMQKIIKLLAEAFVPTNREKMSTKSFSSDLGGQYL